MSRNGRQSETTATGETLTPAGASDDATTETHSSQPTPVSDAAAYRCPICQATYDNELLARIHITRADDDAHAHHNGLMPESDIEAVDGDGEVIETITRSPGELDPETLTIEDFPTDISEKRRHALLVAARNPYEASARELTARIEERADETDLQVPGYRTVCRALNSFYQPNGGDEAAAGAGDESLSELTPKQQAIVIARLAAPEASEADVADMVGCAGSYPGQVYDRAGHVLDRLAADCEGDTDVAAVIAAELSAADIDTLHEQGLLAEVPVEVPRDDADGSEVAATGAATQADGPAEQAAQWGSPLDNQTGLRADPADPFEAADDEPTAAAAAQTTLSADQPADDEPAAPSRDGTDESARGSTTGGERPDIEAGRQVPAGDVELLRRQVAFLVDVFDRVADPEPGTKRLLALAEQVHDECAVMLDRAREG